MLQVMVHQNGVQNPITATFPFALAKSHAWAHILTGNDAKF